MGAILIAGSRGYPASYGGFETLAHKLAERWSEQNIETVVTGFSGFHKKPMQVLSHKGQLINTVTINLPIWSRMKNLVSTLIAVFYTARKYEIDYALVLNDVNLPSALWLKLCKIKTVLHLDGDETARRGLPKMGKVLHTFFRSLAFRFIDNLVVDSTALLQTVPMKYKNKIHVVKYGVDPEEVYRIEVSLDSFPVKDNYILAIARFVPENNLKEILIAYLASDCKYPLVIIGKGTGGRRYEEDLENLAQLREGKVYVLSATYDTKLIHYLLANSSLYVHGHEAGGTNPILVSARCFAKNIAAHDNVYNREGSGHRERFWNELHQLTEILNRLEDGSKDTDTSLRREPELESWDSIATTYLNLIKGSGF